MKQSPCGGHYCSIRTTSGEFHRTQVHNTTFSNSKQVSITTYSCSCDDNGERANNRVRNPKARARDEHRGLRHGRYRSHTVLAPHKLVASRLGVANAYECLRSFRRAYLKTTRGVGASSRPAAGAGTEPASPPGAAGGGALRRRSATPRTMFIASDPGLAGHRHHRLADREEETYAIRIGPEMRPQI